MFLVLRLSDAHVGEKNDDRKNDEDGNNHRYEALFIVLEAFHYLVLYVRSSNGTRVANCLGLLEAFTAGTTELF